MGQYPIIAYILIVALTLAMASLPPFRLADAPPSPTPNRIPTLDGLRGFLALSVALHHGAAYLRYYQDGTWTVPPSRLFTFLGEGGVAMFFMVTGYLFWSRLIAQDGRPDWLRLYAGRLFRIGPVYLVAIAGVLATVLPATGWTLQVTPFDALRQTVQWLSLGVLGNPDINGYNRTSLLLAGVAWSLRYEWGFYLLLPLLALVARRPRAHLPAAAGALALCLIFNALGPNLRVVACTALFLAGMTTASLHRVGWRLPPAALRWADPAAAALLVFVPIAFWSAYFSGAILALGIAFYLIASGCSLFGLLLTRPAQRLGDVSYGIYLLQGLVFTAILPRLPPAAYTQGTPLAVWTSIGVCTLLIVILATSVHVLVERPGIRLGQSVANRLAGRPARSAALLLRR